MECAVTTCACCNLEKPVTVALHCNPDVSLCSDCLDWLSRRLAKRAAASSGTVRVVSMEPTFRVADVDRAVEHYQCLGFDTEYHDATYAFANRDGITVHLAHIDTADQATPATIFLHVTDADRLAADWREAGVEVDGPEDQDYGLREGSHADPDGNRIRFGSPMHT
jgi:catechol 2,3-dioxygenase-like lactoylglutathione lyase family enzyme